MKWTDTTPKPRELYAVCEIGNVRLSISIAHKDKSKRWQHILVTAGEHTTDSFKVAQKCWPRQALTLVRQALDEFEAKLEEGE